MAKLDFHYLGSFQKGLRLTTENPTEEVWSRFDLYSSLDYLNDNLDVTKIPKDEATRYVATRIRQALEFRASAGPGTLLSAPLSLYYAFLNLTRACLVIYPETFSVPSHGLQFNKRANILECTATLQKRNFHRLFDRGWYHMDPRPSYFTTRLHFSGYRN